MTIIGKEVMKTYFVLRKNQVSITEDAINNSLDDQNDRDRPMEWTITYKNLQTTNSNTLSPKLGKKKASKLPNTHRRSIGSKINSTVANYQRHSNDNNIPNNQQNNQLNKNTIDSSLGPTPIVNVIPDGALNQFTHVAVEELSSDPATCTSTLTLDDNSQDLKASKNRKVSDSLTSSKTVICNIA